MSAAPAPAEGLVCAFHPERETLLRCARCARPICVQCAVRHPVGLRCRECARLSRLPPYQVGARHLGLGLAGGVVAATGGAFLLQLLPGIFLALILSPLVGGFVGEVIHRISGGKQGQAMIVVALVALLLGAVLSRLLPVLLVRPEAGLPLLASPQLYLALLFNPALLLFLLLGGMGAVARLR